MVYNVTVQISAYKEFSVNANSTSEAREIAERNAANMPDSEKVQNCHIYTLECWSTSLQRLYDKACDEDYADPDGCGGIIAFAECLDDPVFIETVKKCEQGVSPDPETLSIITEICFRLLLYYRDVREDYKYGWDCKQRAIRAAEAVLPFYKESDDFSQIIQSAKQYS